MPIFCKRLFAKKKKLYARIFHTGSTHMFQRVLIILHLCLAFGILLYLLLFPFLGAHFSVRSDLLIVESAMGKSSLLEAISSSHPSSSSSDLSYKRESFPSLSIEDQKFLLETEAELHREMNLPFSKRAARFGTLFISIPLSLWAWLILSFYLSVRLLRGKCSASWAIWLLPLLASLYGLENSYRGKLSPLDQLIPRESVLLDEKTVDDMEGLSWIEQEQARLKGAWKHFLVGHYGDPEVEPEAKRVALAERNFQVAWVKLLPKDRFLPLQEKHSSLVLLLFIGWNLFFAWKSSRLIKSP
jgi:hypothetical protein